ncbi:MAG: peroxide stress protein YaaA [Planctomycetota bacterium]
MLILLSPAKTLDFETEESLSSVVRRAGTTPDFLQDSAELVALLKKLSPKRLGSLMSISDDLAQLNHGRYQDWTSPMPDSETRPSVLAFKGDVYLGLRAESLTDKQLLYAQDHLRILSGLYGLLRPLDAMLPYRLEMGTRLKSKRGADLYEFWGDTITKAVDRQLEAVGCGFLLNLASNEYFRSVRPKQLGAPVISPVFKDLSNGKYRVISFFAKKARGTMARWVIRQRVKTPKKLVQFSDDGYRYDEDSSTDLKPVFLRDSSE